MGTLNQEVEISFTQKRVRSVNYKRPSLMSRRRAFDENMSYLKEIDNFIKGKRFNKFLPRHYGEHIPWDDLDYEIAKRIRKDKYESFHEIHKYDLTYSEDFKSD